MGRRYRCGDSWLRFPGTDIAPGEVFEYGFLPEQEAALLAGGAIERVSADAVAPSVTEDGADVVRDEDAP